MKTTLPFAPTFLAIAMGLAACGGTIAVDPITRDDGKGGTSSGDPSPTNPGTTTPAPQSPIGPYTGLVGTTDVSILYPLPAAGESKEFVLPAAGDAHGQLLPSAVFEAVLPGGRLDRVDVERPSGYQELRLVSLRLDHCSARKGLGCTSEVRAVFQALYDKTGFAPDNDPSTGMAATDGGIHVIYDVPEAELIVMMKQILTLKAANGGLASQILEPHPILVKQGLGGPFAQGLSRIIREHIGGDRIARITTFDHNFDPDGDGWTFSLFDNVGGTFTKKNIPHAGTPSQLVFGSRAFEGPIAQTTADSFSASAKDPVSALLAPSRPTPGAPDVALKLQPAFESSIRVQNPDVHNAETTDCGNCHLAEGARVVGQSVYSLVSAQGGFGHPKRNLGYKSERNSVTNLHAFGYLHRKISIMARTANESAVVADWMEEKVK